MSTFQEGHTVPDGDVGPLEHEKETGPPDSRIDKPTLQEDHPSVQGDQDLQVCQEGQGDHRSRCIYEYPGGIRCYLCDPRHLYWLKQTGC
jgi:hypothetical protein